jgi:hypothetical protein
MNNHHIHNVQYLLIRSQYNIINVHQLGSPRFYLRASNNLRTTREIFHTV